MCLCFTYLLQLSNYLSHVGLFALFFSHASNPHLETYPVIHLDVLEGEDPLAVLEDDGDEMF